MITLREVVYVFFGLLGAACIYALLFYALWYCEKSIPQAPAILWIALRIFLVLSAVIVLIGIIFQLLGHPLIRFD